MHLFVGPIKAPPTQQQHHHHSGNLHNFHRLVAGFFYALNVLPPKVERNRKGEKHSGAVDGDVGGPSKQMPQAGGHQCMSVRGSKQFIDQTRDILTSRNA